MSSAEMSTGPPAGGRGIDRVVSPELALVDPALAAVERARLPEPPSSLRVATRRDARHDDGFALRALASAALEDERRARRRAGPRAWPRLAAVAFATVVALLLLDVRVDVGRTPAAAEGTDETPAAAEGADETPAADPTAELQPRTKGAPAPRNPTPAPAPATKTPVPRRFAWAPVAGADAYRVEIFLAEARVFSAISKTAQLTVPGRWRLGGKLHTLTAGEYRWYVWPITSGRRSQNAVVQATLTVP